MLYAVDFGVVFEREIVDCDSAVGSGRMLIGRGSKVVTELYVRCDSVVVFEKSFVDSDSDFVFEELFGNRNSENFDFQNLWLKRWRDSSPLR